ncbi:MAG: NADH dehydrogenase subunit [Anaerolineae bacterium]|nr:NADH dehydrogenase subunit [Anaerolineae bacterium]
MEIKKVDEGKFVVPIGPQHPALKEPGHFEFTVDGEIVMDAKVRLGFVHRGIEKMAEQRTYTRDLYLMERVCGICSHVHGTAFTLGVEKLAGVTAPPRAQAIRVIIAELERIHSHLLWLGVAAHEGGFDTLFMYSWRDRETVMDLLELLSGNRVHYSANVLGGVKFDINPVQTDQIRRGVDYLEERTQFYQKVVTTDNTFLGRTRGVGYMSREQAELQGAVGPTARASGVTRDVRVDAPYSFYPQTPVQIVLDDGGDLTARFIVRIKELFEAYRLVRLLLDNLPEGELATRMPRRIPAGEVISRVEAPRGELMYFIRSNGTDMPERVKIRTPSLCNWGTITSTAVGLKLADMPMLLAGIDPCFSCNDRMIRVRRAGEPGVMTWDQIKAGKGGWSV